MITIKVDSIWNGFLAFIVMFAIGYMFYPTFQSMLDISETETKIFLGAIISLVTITMIFYAPIEIVISDDKGRMN